MKRVLLTGMSGTGKTSVVRALTARGYKAVETDDGYDERGPDGEQLWREKAIQALLATEDADILFLSGCVGNQGTFYPLFDLVILLSAPAEVMLKRLETRTNNPYGKTPEARAEVLDNLHTVEPLLRRSADCEIRTDVALEAVVTQVLQRVTDL
jgi:dephospho-CoA kinase